MDSAAPRRSDRRARKIMLSAMVVLFSATAISITSLALFTDQQSVDGNAFTTGTIDLQATPATAVVTMASMVPGDEIVSPLALANTGTLELRYSATSTTTEDVLAAALELTVKSGVTSCDKAGWAADGVVLYSGAVGSTATTTLFGNPAPGTHTGDRVLAPGASESLCLHVTLPPATTAGAGTATAATFTFDAEQTANNP